MKYSFYLDQSCLPYPYGFMWSDDTNKFIIDSLNWFANTYIDDLNDTSFKYKEIIRNRFTWGHPLGYQVDCRLYASDIDVFYRTLSTNQLSYVVISYHDAIHSIYGMFVANIMVDQTFDDLTLEQVKF